MARKPATLLQLRFAAPFMLLILSAMTAHAARPSMQQNLQSLRVVEDQRFATDEARRNAISQMYDELFASGPNPETLHELGNDDLVTLFEATHTAAFYSLDSSYLQDMARYLAELEQRALASKSHYKHMHRMLVATRQFHAARALSAKHPSADLEPLPTLRETAEAARGGPTEWVVSADGRELLRRPATLLEPVQIVVIGHPLCHFSQNAARDIQADPVLQQAFAQHGKWLAPQDGNSNYEVFGLWNREHPAQAMTIAYQRKEWPAFDTWGTPTFYFLQRGTVVAKIVGWPPEGRRDELLVALRRVGLLSAQK